jgi:hypothetical protein
MNGEEGSVVRTLLMLIDTRSQASYSPVSIQGRKRECLLPRGGSRAAEIERPKGTLEQGASSAAVGVLRSLKQLPEKSPISCPTGLERKVHVFEFEFRKSLLGDPVPFDHRFLPRRRGQGRDFLRGTRRSRRSVEPLPCPS